MRLAVVLALLLAGCATPSAPPTPASPSPLATEAVAAATATIVATAAPPTAAPSETPAPPATAAATATPAPNPTDTPTPEPEKVAVFGNGNQFINLRREPGTDAPVIKSVRDGTEVVVVGPDRQADGRIWRNVQEGDATGWIISTALRAIPTPAPTPSSTPTLTPGPTATVTPSAAPTLQPAATATATATPAPPEPTATPEPPQEPVEVFGTGSGGANIRAEPGTSSQIVGNVPDGTRLTVIGPDREVDGRTWRNIEGASGLTGWIVTDVVRSLVTPTPAPTDTPLPAAATDTPTPAPVPGTGTPRPGTPTGTPGASASAPEDEEPAPERVEVYGTGTQGANLRAQPGRSGSVLRSVPDGSQLTVVGEDRTVDGIVWRNVQAEDGVTGWLADEVVETLVTPIPTPRPGAPGIGAPLAPDPEPEDQQTEEERAATPCRPGQIKGDAAVGVFYPVDHPAYADLRQRVRCFDDVGQARASGFLPPEVLAPTPAPSPAPEPAA